VGSCTLKSFTMQGWGLSCLRIVISLIILSVYTELPLLKQSDMFFIAYSYLSSLFALIAEKTLTFSAPPIYFKKI